MTATEQEATMPDDTAPHRGWGGRRPGAGRPEGSGEDLVDLDTQVRRDQMDWLDRVRDAAGDRSRAVTVRRVLDEARRVQALRIALADPAGPQRVEFYQVLDFLDGKADPQSDLGAEDGPAGTGE